MAYRVLILEDDPMVASIDRQYVESNPQFHVVQTCKSGAQALEYLFEAPADLIILDYYTPGMNGQEFLDRLHAAGQAPAVIMVIGSRATMPNSLFQSTLTLTGAIALGATEYSGDAKTSLIAVGVVLFLLTVIINLAFALIRGKEKRC